MPVKPAIACATAAVFLSLGLPAFAQDDDSTQSEPETAGGGAVASIATGGALQQLIDVPVMALEALGTVGGRHVGAQGSFMFGRTQYGLGYERGTLGLAMGTQLERWGVGLSVYFGYLSITRHTEPVSLEGGTLGASLQASFDFVSWKRSALFTLARVTGEFGALPILGGGLAVGYRFGP